MEYYFDLLDEEALERALKDRTLLPYKKVDGRKDERWNTRIINGKVHEAIMSGKSIPKIAKSFREVLDMNRVSAYRNARTSMTSCQNSARFDAMEEAMSEGIKMQKQWMATHDGRTRMSHAHIDGETVPVDEEFSNGLMYPADEDGDPEEVYNCRCTMISVVDGVDPKLFNPNAYTRTSEDVEDVFDGIVNGEDISMSWARRPNEFAFEIEDVINAQGFDGKPRVVSAEEFEKAVKESNFIAQRAYTAPDQETLDVYRDQLYNGKWYVDCSNGGSNFGQGMYSMSINGTNVTEKMNDAIKEYQMSNGFSNIETFTLTPDAKVANYEDIERIVIKEAQEAGQTLTREDVGVKAAKLGYDAINVPFSLWRGYDYTIVLNRTKVIFLEP